ncbi:MAG: hypothetical protein V3T14_04385 [Myxococcota bacterium]
MVPRVRRGALLAVLVVSLACETFRAALDEHILRREVELTFGRSVELLPPEQLRVVSTRDRSVALRWDPVLVGDVVGYAILRGGDENGPFALVGRTSSRFGTVFTDVGSKPGSLGDGQTYHYRVQPFDTLGRVGTGFATTRAVTEAPPVPPPSLRTYSHQPRRVVLSWEGSPDESVVGYAVYRAPTAGGPWDRVVYVRDRFRTLYEDPVAGDLRVMYYRVTGLNRFGGEGEPTSPVRAVTKAEPLPPIGLALTERTLGSIGLQWDRNPEADLLEYEVWRERLGDGDGSREKRIARVTAPGLEFVDGAVGCGEPVRYRVRAVDQDGLVSDFSDALEAKGEELGAHIDRAGEKLVVRWDPERASGWIGARVYRRRPFAPDALLAAVNGAAEVELPALAPGRHRLEVVLTRPAVSAGIGGLSRVRPSFERSPRCELILEIPGGPLEPAGAHP